MNSYSRSYETSWTWKKGDSMKRTLRENRKNRKNVNERENRHENKKIEFIENNVINTSLNENSQCISDFSQQNISQSENFHQHPTSIPSFMDSTPPVNHQYKTENIKAGKMTFKRDNIRCENNEKLSTREHIIQRKVNPFLVDNDFKKDLEIQNEFLIPKNSNFEKEETLSL
jgi:hypothetical protein